MFLFPKNIFFLKSFSRKKQKKKKLSKINLNFGDSCLIVAESGIITNFQIESLSHLSLGLASFYNN